MLSSTQVFLFVSLLTVALVVCIFGLNNYVLLYFSRKSGNLRKKRNVKDWPYVTIQIPTYNEKNVIEGTLENCLKIDYPKDKVEIVVVDDSTDETTEILRRYEAKYYPRIKVVHRPRREGYKAGALNTAMKHSDGEFFLILDADTSPDRGLLKETIRYFLADEKIGFIQAKIEYVNAEFSWLTRTLALVNDWYGNFNQSALSKGGMFLGFLGHGGVFRKSALEDAGKWESDTIAEDLDISYRVQLKGWRGLFIESAKCVEEVPSFYLTAILQYNRQLKGPTQNLWKHGSKILKSKGTTTLEKFEALVQIAYPLSYPLGLFCVALSVLAYLFVPRSFFGHFWSSPFGIISSLFMLATSPYISLITSFRLPSLLIVTFSPLFFFLAVKRRNADAAKYLGKVLGAALMWNDSMLIGTKSIIELLLRRKAIWIPTPKIGNKLEFVPEPSHKKKLKRNTAQEAILRIASAILVISCFVLITQKNFIANAFGLLLPASGWLVSAYFMLKKFD